MKKIAFIIVASILASCATVNQYNVADYEVNVHSFVSNIDVDYVKRVSCLGYGMDSVTIYVYPYVAAANKRYEIKMFTKSNPYRRDVFYIFVWDGYAPTKFDMAHELAHIYQYYVGLLTVDSSGMEYFLGEPITKKAYEIRPHEIMADKMAYRIVDLPI